MPGPLTRNKRPLFFAALFLLLFWIVTYQVKAGRFAPLERPVLAVSGFVERLIAAPVNAVRSVVTRYVLNVRAQRENERLRKQVARLTLENQITNELLAENERLHAMLGFKRAQPPRSVAVQVIGRGATPASTTFTVNKGSDGGLARDQAVITPDGVVGRIIAVSPAAAKVQLITDPGSTLAVRVMRNREEGLLEGRFDRCALKFVSFYADIQEGDQLVTSGLDGIYPKGLLVAVVTSVDKHEARSFQTVFAKPAAAFSRLEEALVLVP